MKYLNYFKNNKDLLQQFRCGLEREALRISKKGNLSTLPHPKALGSPLTHPYFKTDFGEAQIEWNTPPFHSFAKAETFLKDLMSYTKRVNPDELYWPYSMPCPLPSSVEIARFGTSHEAQKKELYRRRLCERYGKNLQMISGIHFNFSFAPSFWDFYYDCMKPKSSKQEFINDSYFKIIQNFLHEGWLLTYLFGATPAAHKTYTKSNLSYPNATSIRMSYLGYYSRIQNQLAISFDNLERYIRDLEYAIKTPHPKYQGGILQMENEHYARIRPRQLLRYSETPLSALKNRGVLYLEIRSIDLNPFSPLGIDREQMLFLHQFLLACLLKEKTPLTKERRDNLTQNQQKVALEGRKNKLKLKRSHLIPFKEWANEILSEVEKVAKLLGPEYRENLLTQEHKIENPNLTPSSLILKELENTSLESFGLKLAKAHIKTFSTVSKRFDESVKASIDKQTALETASEILLEGHEDLELSTQILMKEAMKQGIDVEVLDSKSSFIRLKKDRHIELVKQATRTRLDGTAVCHLMKNKYLTKKLLSEQGFSVPLGACRKSPFLHLLRALRQKTEIHKSPMLKHMWIFDFLFFDRKSSKNLQKATFPTGPLGKLYIAFEEALSDYSLYSKKKIVIKPNRTNFGIGITFVNAQDKKGYKSALKEAFLHDTSVLVEEYHRGEEYRFLVIGGKVHGVVKRIPANITGDGIHTIKELVHLKNNDKAFYRSQKTHLRLTKVEKEVLKEQKLNIDHIPRIGKQLFLRKNSNVSTGGDAIDMTDDVHASYLEIAARAAKAIGANICGVDMLISSPKKRASKMSYALIELNENPVLFFHAFPNQGKRRNVAKPILKLLGF